jgi:hypothetical protein
MTGIKNYLRAIHLTSLDVAKIIGKNSKFFKYIVYIMMILSINIYFCFKLIWRILKWKL